MKNLIDAIKRYGIEIACGAGALLGVLLIVLGLGRMQAVNTELESAVRVKDDITNMARGQVINQKAVDQSAKLIADITLGFDQVMAYVRERNAYTPLVPGAFPGGTREDVTNAIKFRTAFNQLPDEWLKQLNAGAEPSAAEIQAEKDRMAAERQQSAGADRGGLMGQGPEPKDTGLTAEQGAALRNARKIYCYATLDAFQVSAVSQPGGPMEERGPPPSVREMWHAQLESWVQQSVVDAIADVNGDAAKKLEERGAAPWVGNLPIKELRSVQTTQYYVKEGLEAAKDQAPAEKDRVYPPGTVSAAFTERQSGELYELMQFTVQLVVDARELSGVLAGLCEHRFHVPLRVQYEAVAPNFAMEGKIYGEAPVVLLTVDFETVFFSDLYLPLMPDEVLTQLGKTRPEQPETTGV
jgi:hypothetical protein